MTSAKLKVRITTMKMVNRIASSRSSPNACTDWTMPDRVMKVPKIVRKNVTITSVTFHTRSMPRRSWTCLLYTSDAADDLTRVDLGGRRIIKKKKTQNKYIIRNM